MHRSCIARGRKSALNMRASDREVISAANLRINAEMRKAWADPADMTHIQEAQRILNQAVDQLAGAPF